ncbi:MAG: hypothetical protein QOH15_1016 [Gaiellales bacterium]|nr:hypothetical protein [Gaiellales bacterium]
MRAAVALPGLAIAFRSSHDHENQKQPGNGPESKYDSSACAHTSKTGSAACELRSG